MVNLTLLIMQFFQVVKEKNIEIYNEFSFQHELGIFLRSALPNYKVQFERNISFFTSDTDTIKKEMDISIFSKDQKQKYALELKYPLNGQHPEQMYSFAKDVKFMEEVKDRNFNATACVVLVSDKLFYEGKRKDGIYKFFREEYSIYGDIFKPTGADKNKECISLSRKHKFTWHNLDDQRRFYIIEIE